MLQAYQTAWLYIFAHSQSIFMSKAFQARPMTATRGMAAWVTWSIHSSTAMRGHVARSIGWAPRGVQCLKDCKAKANLGQLLCQLQQMQTCYQNWVFLVSKSVPLKFSKTCSLDPVWNRAWKEPILEEQAPWGTIIFRLRFHVTCQSWISSG